jgi:hypothetical protein
MRLTQSITCKEKPQPYGAREFPINQSKYYDSANINKYINIPNFGSRNFYRGSKIRFI